MVAPVLASDARQALLLIVHANGFCKEVLFPLQQHLVSALEEGGLGRVVSVVVDLPGHGDAEPLNYKWDPGMVKAVVDWDEYGSHIRAQINSKLQDMAIESGEARPLILAFGHSIGGAACTLASLQDQDLIDGMVLFEPVLFKPHDQASPLTRPTLARRSSFSSPEEAFLWFKGKSLFAKVSDEALRLYCKHGLRQEGDVWVLKCKPEVEAANFATSISMDRYEMLEAGRLTTSMVIMSGVSTTLRFTEKFYRELLGACPRTSFKTLECGHLGPMEEPQLVAAHAARAFLELSGVASSRL